MFCQSSSQHLLSPASTCQTCHASSVDTDAHTDLIVVYITIHDKSCVIIEDLTEDIHTRHCETLQTPRLMRYFLQYFAAFGFQVCEEVLKRILVAGDADVDFPKSHIVGYIGKRAS